MNYVTYGDKEFVRVYGRAQIVEKILPRRSFVATER